MKLNLKKTQLVNLSQDDKVLPNDLTPQIGGGGTFFSGGEVCAPKPTLGCATFAECSSQYSCVER